MKKPFCVLLLIVLCAGMTSVASATDWQQVDYDNALDISFDAQSFQKTGDTSYTFWKKWQYDESSGKKIAKSLGFAKPISYTLEKVEYDYSANQYRTLFDAIYTKDASVLSSDDTPDAEWEKVYSESLNGYICELTYEYYKKHYQ